MSAITHLTTPVLDIAYHDSGPTPGVPVILLHGFPYDVHAFAEVAPLLNAAGVRTVVPYLRGYGATQFLASETMRTGEQAALGQDLLDLMDGLDIRRAVLAGFDWGGRAACVAAALWPERVHSLVTCTGYQLQDIAGAGKPADPEQERRFWYQYYFHTERGRIALTQQRRAFNKLLWAEWSPAWAFDDATYERTAAAFDNPDFVDVVIHSYRHRMGNAAGDPRYGDVENRLATLPKIGVPTMVIHGDNDAVNPVRKSEGHKTFFTGPYERRVFANIGHNPPQEAPKQFAEAVLAVCANK